MQQQYAAVDWSDWTVDEQLAALNRVLIARNRNVVMNAAELEESLDKPERLQLPSRTPPQPKQSPQREFEVVATYNGITVKGPDGVPLQATQLMMCTCHLLCVDVVHGFLQ
jgi:hypothetical protein